MAITDVIGGMASPEMASEFAQKNRPAPIAGVGADVRRNVANILSLPYNVFVRAPVHLVTRVARTGFNVVFGMPWAAGQKASKILEDVVDYPVNKAS